MTDGRAGGRRAALAVIVAAAAAGFGAVVLGEYDLSGPVGLVAGAVFGAVVAEIAVTVAGPARPRRIDVMIAVVAGAGLAWAAYISSGRGVRPVPAGAWLGIVAGVVTAVLWVRSGLRRGASNGSST